MVLLVAATEMELCGHEGLVCGVGPVEAAAATARALALESPTALLHVGLAGAQGLETGAVVVGTGAVYCDIAAQWPVVDRVQADSRLVHAVLGVVPGASAQPIHTSATVGRARDTVSRGVVVEAMEGFGVLRAAVLAGVPAVEVRVISNRLGEPDRARWDVEGARRTLERALPELVAAVRQAAD